MLTVFVISFTSFVKVARMSLKSNPIQTHSIFTTVLTHFWSILDPSSHPGGAQFKIAVQIFCFGFSQCFMSLTRFIRFSSAHWGASSRRRRWLVSHTLPRALFQLTSSTRRVIQLVLMLRIPSEDDAKRKSLWMSTTVTVSRGFSQFDIFSNILHWTTPEPAREVAKMKSTSRSIFKRRIYNTFLSINWHGLYSYWTGQCEWQVTTGLWVQTQ